MTTTHVLVEGTTWAGFCSPGIPAYLQKTYYTCQIVILMKRVYIVILAAVSFITAQNA